MELADPDEVRGRQAQFPFCKMKSAGGWLPNMNTLNTTELYT